MNRSPSHILESDVLQRMWSGESVNYSHLRFGCKAFVHVPKKQQVKLDDRAVECIFLGYGDEKFGNRFWDLKNWRLICSRDVVFIL